MTGVASRADLLNAGLYPLAEPEARARLCLSCHQGSESRPVTHKLFGAGHPPINRFELDTYTATQPAHFRIDADYRKRKTVASGVRTWMAGQAQAAAGYLDELLSSRFAQHGAFPELAAYDCDGCHRPMDQRRYSGGGNPGSPQLADAALAMVGHAVAVFAPQSAANWQQSLAALRKAGQGSVAEVKGPAAQLKAQLTALRPLLAAKEPSITELRSLLTRLAQEAAQQGGDSYLVAAQTTQAIAAMTADRTANAALSKAIKDLFKATADAATYDPAAFRNALKAAQSSLAALQ
jgi:hypothetical protein